MKWLAAFLLAGATQGFAGPAAAWGDLGHRVTAIIAYRHLTPAAKTRVDALLAVDADPLTAADFASRATWADKYRNAHRETAPWHYADIEIDRPDLQSACAQGCIVEKIAEFDAELKNPSTAPAARLIAFKFLLHFIGDVHQPLHASDHHDRGGNCIGLASSPDGRDWNLHAYWDTGVVDALGGSAEAIAMRLDGRITPQDIVVWGQGDAAAWAMESFELARKDVYALPSRPTCDDRGAVTLTPQYQATAVQDAALQLSKAGIRLAVALNREFET
jgi:S1/P1 Nuclease